MAKSMLQTKTNPLSYNRVPFDSLKMGKPIKAKYPKGSVLGAPGVTTNSQLKKRMGAKAYGAIPTMSSYKKGGTVKKTGPALLHNGEKVLSVSQKKKLAKQLSRNYS